MRHRYFVRTQYGVIKIKSLLAISRITSLSKEALKERLSAFATIDLNINYLRPGRGKNLLQVEKSFALVIRFLLPGPNCIITKINISQQA
ncbi:hypothetical protein ARSQ2_00307 [Arsenophonus endosymbiont of Bemisia tabaci Q2]|nr:hypothetical protein ARSQ2_00307 [Arsenophonus endosymbiont of Bemisia tabaci Q2]